MSDLNLIAEALQKGKMREMPAMVQGALDKGLGPKEILEQGLIAGMNVIGKKFKNNEVFIPEVLVAANTMKAGMGVLEPHLAKAGVKPLAKVVIGTVKGDLHDIGKNLVIMMFKGAGFEVQDIGIDVSKEKFVAAASDPKCAVIGLSALLTTTMPAMRDAVKALRDSGVKAKILVGGAPVTKAFADEIGADGYATDAASAVEVGKKLCGMATPN